MRIDKVIEFADFGVYKAWQFSKDNVRRDPIFEMETYMATHQVNEVGGATSHYPSRSQQAFHLKASVSNRLLVGEILSLRLRHLWARIGSKKWDVSLSGDFYDPSRSQRPLATKLVSLDREILSLRRRHLWHASDQ